MLIDRNKHFYEEEYSYDPPSSRDDERAQLTRTFSPPAPRARPFPLIISHQSDEALHHINSDSCCIGSAGSSHSSGFNESMLETLEGENSLLSAPVFHVDSPLCSEYDLDQMRDEDGVKRTSSNCVFEGFGGPENVETLDYKDMNQLIKSLTHKNKVLTQERRVLEMQLAHQEDILDKMELEMGVIKRERKEIEKLKKEEGSRMRSENKELEYSLEKLRQQRIEAENKLQLMEREKESNKMQIEEVRLQLQQAIEEHMIQKERNNELIRQLENKERQLSSLADDYKQDSDMNMASQYKMDELSRENQEMKRHVEQLKSDKELLAANLTKVTCELSRLKQGVPLSPTSSTNSSLTSPIVDEIYGRQDPSSWNYHSLPPVFEEGDTIDELLCNKTEDSVDTCSALEEIEHGYINISEIMDERCKLIQRNEQLEQELNDMKQLMYVVAPQHYIDDEALQFNNNNSRVHYTKPVEIQYECLTAGHEMRLTPSLDVEEEEDSPNASLVTLAGIPDIPELQIPEVSCIPENKMALHSAPCLSDLESHQHSTPDLTDGLTVDEMDSAPSSEHSAPSSVHSGAESREPSDDADSGVLCQSSTDLQEESCESCTLWHPEKELLIGKVVKSELNLEQVKSERDRLEYELNLLQPPRWRGWLLHFTALLILLTLIFTCYPIFPHHQCKHSNPIHWTDFFSFKIVHLKHRNYQIPH
ncbi:hypothetical protein ACHWQZ_G010301 [Mnemiopsis leidyi]